MSEEQNAAVMRCVIDEGFGRGSLRVQRVYTRFKPDMYDIA